MKAFCKCEIILKGLEETAAIAGGIEEVVDRVEEEDEEAQDRQHGIRVHRVPGYRGSRWQLQAHTKVEYD